MHIISPSKPNPFEPKHRWDERDNSTKNRARRYRQSDSDTSRMILHIRHLRLHTQTHPLHYYHRSNTHVCGRRKGISWVTNTLIWGIVHSQGILNIGGGGSGIKQTQAVSQGVRRLPRSQCPQGMTLEAECVCGGGFGVAGGILTLGWCENNCFGFEDGD